MSVNYGQTPPCVFRFTNHRCQINGGCLATRTACGLVLPHPGLDDVGLDGVARPQLVVVPHGEAPPALLVQVGVGRLRAAVPRLSGAGEGARSALPATPRERTQGQPLSRCDAAQCVIRCVIWCVS